MSLKEFDAASGDEAHTAAAAPQPAPRISAQMLRLFTDPAQNQVQRIELAALVESPFNPRTTYNERALEELAESIRTAGVMQPILVRPLPTTVGPSMQGFEIVFGHRRTRGARLAGESHMPAIVRELTDAQAAQLQAIENVQREDLNPLETARSYEQYMAAHGVDKKQLAKEIGLSPAHVYGYLKLLTALPSIQEAVQKGDIGPDVAIKIARLHSPKVQERALAALKGRYYDLEDGGKKSVRQIQDFLAEKFTLDLKTALFDGKDAQLLPDAGACTECPKRTGNAPEYADLANSRPRHYGHRGQRMQGAPNLCTDPDCFEAKKKAHLAIEAGKLAAKGKTVVEGNKARQAVGADGKVKGAYVALSDLKAQLKKAGKKAADLPVVVIQNPRDGSTVEALRIEDAKYIGVKVKEADSGRPTRQSEERYEATQRKRREQAVIHTRENCAILSAVRKAAAAHPRSTFDLQLIAAVTFNGAGWEEKQALATMYGCEDANSLQKKIGQMDAQQLALLMLDCALMDNVVASEYRMFPAEPLLKAAKHYGVDVDEARKEVAGLAVDVRTEDLLRAAAGSAAPVSDSAVGGDQVGEA